MLTAEGSPRTLHHPGLVTPSARYLHAVCCIKLGKLNDAREVLTKFGELEVRACVSIGHRALPLWS